MVCLKADAERIKLEMDRSDLVSDFVDEDLGDMRTAIALGPFERDVGMSRFGDLSLA